MKRAERITYALMSFAMLFATTAFAANKGSLHVQSTTMAGTTQLPAGEYTVQWEGPGPDVELKIKLHNRVKGHGTCQSDTAGPAAQRRCGNTGHRRQRRPEVA